MLLLLAVLAANSQIGGGSIVGTVRDPSGAAVPNVRVLAHNQDTNEERTVTTNREGYYEFPLLTAGRYQVTAEASGFKGVAGEVFTLYTGTRPRIDFSLAIGDVSEKIEVDATAPQINTTTTDLGVVMTRARVDELPLNGRNFQELVGLQAGVAVAP
ncbi:MAG TPA: carboxypeptidase-like regulatory domain-containing protein, partial [Bryobacteraceae bacterium]|nr:carboxypeptidase-like regulatory domain-containing protein [Bryobacteraceae bacterium]